MADDIDLANDLVDREVSLALNKMRQHADQNKKGSKYCIECGDNMPAGRMKLGFNLCVPCAEEAERKKSLFAD
ncbi:MAG: hypothetical protein ACD_46C00711G0003 [uncultured bacterium]|nr:MAG: hypothetical protein ACD_46C00711G0003 [uncultured bacterium]